MAIDKKLQIFDDEGNPVDYDILASDVKFNDGKDLPTKLAEMEEEIGEGGYTPPAGGIPKTDLAPSVQQTLDDVASKVDKETGKGLSSNDYTTEEKAKLGNLPTADQLTQQMNSKANDNAVIKSITVNGQTQSKDTNGNVNIEVEGADGKSAYQIACDNGFSGTQTEWLASLKGRDGITDGDDVVVVHDTNGEPSDLEQGQVAVLGADMGVLLGKLLNTNDNTLYNVWVGTQQQLEALNGDYDDNTIYLVGTVPTVAQRFNVSFNGGSHTSIPANTPQTVTEGSAFSVVVSPADGYTIDSATGTMAGGGTLTKTENPDGTVTFSTSSVTGAITIQAAATKYITRIEVSAGTRNNNTIPLTAVVEPTDADNVTLAWSIDNTTDFVITDNGNGTATLTVNSGASNASVNITCQDTNADSGTQSGTLQLTGITHEATPIPVTEITDITATRTAANTLKLDATSDGNTGVSFSIVGTSPKSKKLDYANSPATLEEVDNVVLNGDTLTYKEDCKVTIQASAENGTVTFQKEITITHDSGDAIWFEDEVTLAALNTNSVGSGGKVTYSQAAAVTAMKFLAGNTSIRRFKELMWFTGITIIGPNASDKATFGGCSSLECIGLPDTISEITGATYGPFNGCALKEVHVSQINVLLKTTMSSNIASFLSAGKDANGLGLFINGTEVTEVEIPSVTYGGASRTSLSGWKLAGFNRLTKVVFGDFLTSLGDGIIAGDTALTHVVIGNGLTTLSQNWFYNSVGGGLTNLSTIDIGSSMSSLSSQLFRGCTGLRTLILRYNGNGVVSQDNSFNQAAALSAIDLYVPSGKVNDYQANSFWSGANSINEITE